MVLGEVNAELTNGWHTRKEMARLLGVSEKELFAMRERGEIREKTVGSRTYFFHPDLENVKPIDAPVRARAAMDIDEEDNNPYIEVLSQETTVCPLPETGAWFPEKRRNEQLKKQIEELLHAHCEKDTELQAAKAEIRRLKEELEHEKSLTAQEKEIKRTVTRVCEDEIRKWYNALRYYRYYLGVVLKRERRRNKTLLQTLQDLENFKWYQSKEPIIERLRAFLYINPKRMTEQPERLRLP